MAKTRIMIKLSNGKYIDMSKAKTIKPEDKVHTVMREFKEGKLKSSSGQVVTSRDQALVIAMSESGLSKNMIHDIAIEYDSMEKAGKEPIGSVATWADGKQYRKVAEGVWQPDKSEKSRGAKISGSTHGHGSDDVSTASKLHERFMNYLQNMSQEHRDLFRGGKFSFEKKEFTSSNGKLALKWDDKHNRVQIVKKEDMQKARTVKYIKRVPKPSGKGYYYFYNQQQFKDYKEKGIVPKEEKGGSFWDKVKSFFGNNADEKVNKLHEIVSGAGISVTKDSLAEHLAEYLSNKEKWDSKFRGEKKEKGETKPKTETAKSEKKENAEKKEGSKWNNSLMKFFSNQYGMIGALKKEEVKKQSQNSEKKSESKDNFETMPEGEDIEKGIEDYYKKIAEEFSNEKPDLDKIKKVAKEKANKINSIMNKEISLDTGGIVKSNKKFTLEKYDPKEDKMTFKDNNGKTQEITFSKFEKENPKFFDSQKPSATEALKEIERTERFPEVPTYAEAPEGFKKVEGTTAPKGYEFYRNGSPLSKDYKQVLVKDKSKVEALKDELGKKGESKGIESIYSHNAKKLSHGSINMKNISDEKERKAFEKMNVSNMITDGNRKFKPLFSYSSEGQDQGVWTDSRMMIIDKKVADEIYNTNKQREFLREKKKNPNKPDDEIIKEIAKKGEGIFPNYKQVIPKEDYISKQDAKFTGKFKKGEDKDSVNIAEYSDGENTYYFQPDLVATIKNKFPNAKMHLNTSGSMSPAVFKVGNEIKAVLMPMQRKNDSGLESLEKALSNLRQEIMFKAQPTKYIKKIPNPNGKGYIYFYTQAQVKEYEKTGKLPDDQKKKPEVKESTGKGNIEILKESIKKVASIFADALSAKDAVQPTGQGVEQTGENIAQKSKDKKRLEKQRDIRKNTKKNIPEEKPTK